jgi:hypothetical protein
MKRFLLPALSLVAAALATGGRAAQPALRASYDLVVYGSTPGGIACAVRAAREGLDVLLVTHAEHIGGILSSGLSTMDTLYNGARAPLYDELRRAIHEHYRATYGADSEQYMASLPGHPKIKFEAHVVERIFETMLKNEPRLTLVRQHYPVAARRELRALRTVTFRAMEGAATFEARGAAFADCSYEGDLLAVASVPYRWGREAREEFNEEHAGRIFVRQTEWPPKHVDPGYLKDYWKLNLFHYQRWCEIIRLQSTGAADRSVQAYNLRTMMTRDPANRVTVEKPAGYDREEILRRVKHDINWSDRAPSVNQPNLKTYLNLPELVGMQHAYVEGDWATRRRITAEHRRLVLSLIYFCQNDESVPEATRRAWREWGLPRDEFPGNGHVPYEIYVREARRLKGRAVFTENDARLAPGAKRAPVHADAISITEWFLDSHACTPEHVPGSLWEGELLLNNITFPGQVSYRTMLAQELDNLVVPVCASSTHIGWGTIRLEPTWMSMAEAAAHGIVLAARQRKTPAEIDPDELVQLLAGQRVMLSFFNDVEGREREPWYPAVQVLGTRGFYGNYDARAEAPLLDALARAWSAAAAGPHGDLDARARAMLAAEAAGGAPVTAGKFATSLARDAADLLRQCNLAPDTPLTRGHAARLVLAATQKSSTPRKP